jgi:hypothetical protein
VRPEGIVRFTLAAIGAGAAWWGIGMASIPDVFLRRSPASLVVSLIITLAIAHLSRPFYRRSAVHLLWLTPLSVYFGAAAFGYLLPLATENVDVLERCLQMMRALCMGVTFSIVALVVFPGAFATHWLLRRIVRWEGRPSSALREA